MLYSKPCEYAIRSMVYVALHASRAVSGREISRAEAIPFPVLSKVLQILVRRKLLRSRRGPGGGFELARKPETISLGDIVMAVDGLEHFQRCAAGLPQCGEDSPCPLHDSWQILRAQLLHHLETTTLDGMASAAARKRAQRRRGKHSSARVA